MKLKVIMMLGMLGVLAGCSNTAPKDQRLASYGKGLPKGDATPIMSAVHDESLVMNDKYSGDRDGDGVIDLRDVSNETLGRGVTVDNIGRAQVLSDVKQVNMRAQFLSDKTYVDKRYYKEIEHLAKLHNNKKGKKILIEGYTDSSGGRKHNEKLSIGRARAIAQVLINKFNVDPNDVLISGLGQEKPVATNSTVAGRKQNRRIIARMVYDDRIVKHDWNVWTVEVGDKKGQIQQYRSLVDKENALPNGASTVSKPKK